MNPKDTITTSEWMLQRKETRALLVSIFGIPKTGFGQTITDATGHGINVTDGYNHKDLSIMTFDRLLTYVGESQENDNVHTLFLKAVQKAETEPTPIAEVVKVVDITIKESLPTPTVPLREERVEEKQDPGINGYKCDRNGCKFATASRIALSMHIGRFHKINT